MTKRITDRPLLPAGRPTKYNSEMQAAAENYAKNWAAAGDKIPSVVGLACELKVAKQTVLNWGKENPEFLDTLRDIEAAQERESLSKGLDGTFNPTITKLVLANHGYSDKSEVDNKSSDGSMTPKDTVTVKLSAEDAYLAMLGDK